MPLTVNDLHKIASWALVKAQDEESSVSLKIQGDSKVIYKILSDYCTLLNEREETTVYFADVEYKPKSKRYVFKVIYNEPDLPDFAYNEDDEHGEQTVADSCESIDDEDQAELEKILNDKE